MSQNPKSHPAGNTTGGTEPSPVSSPFVKGLTLVARYLLALTFIVFGLNGFLHFLNPPPPTSDLARQFFTVLVVSHYSVVVFGVQVLAGVMFLFRRTVPLALVLIAPVIVNILTYHLTMDPAGIVPGAVATALWFVVFWHFRRAFDGVLNAV